MNMETIDTRYLIPLVPKYLIKHLFKYCVTCMGRGVERTQCALRGVERTQCALRGGIRQEDILHLTLERNFLY